MAEYNLKINCETIGSSTVLGTLMKHLMELCKNASGELDETKFKELVQLKGEVIVSGYNCEFLAKKFPEQEITRRDLVMEDVKKLREDGWQVMVNLNL